MTGMTGPHAWAVLIHRPGQSIIHPDTLAVTGPYETLETAELMAGRFNGDTDYVARVFGVCPVGGALAWWDWTRRVDPLEHGAVA